MHTKAISEIGGFKNFALPYHIVNHVFLVIKYNEIIESVDDVNLYIYSIGRVYYDMRRLVSQPPLHGGVHCQDKEMW